MYFLITCCAYCTLQEFLYAILGHENIELVAWDTASHTVLAQHKASFIVFSVSHF